MIMKQGEVVEGDIVEMMGDYEIHSSTEAWIITEAKKEILEVRRLLSQINKIANWKQAGPFICGASDEERIDGLLPQYIHVCPMYGADVRMTEVYKKVEKNDI
jgi:hypothetical protein